MTHFYKFDTVNDTLLSPLDTHSVAFSQWF